MKRFTRACITVSALGAAVGCVVPTGIGNPRTADSLAIEHGHLLLKDCSVGDLSRPYAAWMSDTDSSDMWIDNSVNPQSDVRHAHIYATCNILTEIGD